MKISAMVLLFAVLAAPGAAAAEPQSQQEKPKKPRLVCKEAESTSSRISRRVCKTEEEWAATSVEDQLDSLRTQGLAPPLTAPLPR